MLLYFLRIDQYFLMKFCTVALGIILMVTTLTQWPRLLEEIWEVFLGPILAYVYVFLDACSIFCHGILYSVLGIILIIINTIFFGIMSSSSGDILRYFGAYFGILRPIFENHSICSHEILCRRSWCYFEGHYIIFFSIS